MMAHPVDEIHGQIFPGEAALDLGIAEVQPNIAISVVAGSGGGMRAHLNQNVAQKVHSYLGELLNVIPIGEITFSFGIDHDDMITANVKLPRVGNIQLVSTGEGQWLATIMHFFGAEFRDVDDTSMPDSELTQAIEAALDHVPDDVWKCDCLDAKCTTLRQHCRKQHP